MIIEILTLFAFVFIVVLAFSSNKKEIRVRRVDLTTGQETVEIHESVKPAPARTAARTALVTFIG